MTEPNSYKMAKAKQDLQELIVDQNILHKIYIVRDEKVILDKDLTELYGV
jgi:hypothetical protein